MNIYQRLERIAAAVGVLMHTDLTTIKPFISEDGSVIDYDFTLGLSEAEMLNRLNTLLVQIDSLRDHLKQWARRHRRDGKAIEAFLKESQDYLIVMDLANLEKHGPLQREGDRGFSGAAPTIVGIESFLRLNGVGGVLFSDDGLISDGGGNAIIIQATVLDKEGNRMGTTVEIIDRALQRCEEAIDHFGILDVPM